MLLEYLKGNVGGQQQRETVWQDMELNFKEACVSLCMWDKCAYVCVGGDTILTAMTTICDCVVLK